MTVNNLEVPFGTYGRLSYSENHLLPAGNQPEYGIQERAEDFELLNLFGPYVGDKEFVHMFADIVTDQPDSPNTAVFKLDWEDAQLQTIGQLIDPKGQFRKDLSKGANDRPFCGLISGNIEPTEVTIKFHKGKVSLYEGLLFQEQAPLSRFDSARLFTFSTVNEIKEVVENFKWDVIDEESLLPYMEAAALEFLLSIPVAMFHGFKRCEEVLVGVDRYNASGKSSCLIQTRPRKPVEDIEWFLRQTAEELCNLL